MIERDLYLGIDPGGSGSLAILDRLGAIVDVTPMPDTLKDLSDYLKEFAPRIRRALIEHVHAMPPSMPGNTSVASFSFGQNFGALQMGLVAHEIPFDFVQPAAWQKTFGLTRKDKTEKITAKKNRHKQYAQQLFPKQKVIHAIADGLLLAETARRSGL